MKIRRITILLLVATIIAIFAGIAKSGVLPMKIPMRIPIRAAYLNRIILSYPIAFIATSNVFFDTGKYYVWGISNTQFYIPVGYIPTEMNLILNGISHINDSPYSRLDFYLIDEPLISKTIKTSFVTNDGDIMEPIDSSYHYLRRKVLPRKPTLLYSYIDNFVGTENVSFNINHANDPNSEYFNGKISKSIEMKLSDSSIAIINSGLLEFMSFAGSGDSMGILLDPEGLDNFIIDDLLIEIKMKTYVGEYSTIVQRISAWAFNSPPFIF